MNASRKRIVARSRHASRTCSRTARGRAPRRYHGLTRERRSVGEEQLVEHARLPRGHRGGAGRGEIGHREQVEIAQTFAAVHLARELGDGRRVVEIAARGHVVHEEVLQDEVAALVDVFGRQARAASRWLAPSRRRAREWSLPPMALPTSCSSVARKSTVGPRDLGGEAARERVARWRDRRARARASDRPRPPSERRPCTHGRGRGERARPPAKTRGSSPAAGRRRAARPAPSRCADGALGARADELRRRATPLL